MDYMDDFFNNQVAAIQETMEAKARAFEKLLQEEREKRANNTSSEIKGVFEFRYNNLTVLFIWLWHAPCSESLLISGNYGMM